ncbi:MAG: hydroxymethylbilane synthase [Burkholderiaceae bacterium]
MTGLLRLGTRSSALALAQSGQIAAALRDRGAAVEIVPLTTPGDGESRPLSGRANEGIFVSSVRVALVEGAIDIAVHSFKDVPTGEVDGLVVAAVPTREDPRDCIISRLSLTELPLGSVVGTCSVRRSAWVHRVRPDLQVAPIRGNIDQRIARVMASEFDAIILAEAGLNRLGCETPGRFPLSVTDLVPAPAQGALSIECRASDDATRLVLHALDNHATRLAVIAERAVLAAIDPTDSTAVGAVATVAGDWLHLLSDISRPDGSGRVMLRAVGRAGGGRPGVRAAHALGTSMAAELRERSARCWAAMAS